MRWGWGLVTGPFHLWEDFSLVGNIYMMMGKAQEQGGRPEHTGGNTLSNMLIPFLDKKK